MESELLEQRHWDLEEGSSAMAGMSATRGSSGGSAKRVLIVDDNGDDRAIIVHQLRDLADLAFTEVMDAAALEEALDAGPFDLLITDYRLYWSDGLTVLARAKDRWPNLPAIMFTGTGSEEVAVEAMKAGVNDYVIKSPKHYPRFRASVEAALKLRRGAALAEAEARYQELFDTVPVGLFRCTPKGRILQANQALAAIAGFGGVEELLNKNFADLHPGTADFQRWRDKLEREGAVAFVESRFKSRGQSNDETSPERWVEIHAKALRDPVTQMVFYEGSVEDISARKEAEAERERLIRELQDALGRVKTLAGLLPICASCKKIRDEGGRWNMLESYIENHSQAHFTHGFCPECARQLYPEVFLDTPKF
jgi:PAS domain S-box-containing protein